MFLDQSQKVFAKALASSHTQPGVRKEAAYAQVSDLLRTAETALTVAPTLNEDSGLIDVFTNNFADSNSTETRTNIFWVPKIFFELLLKRDAVKLSAQCTGAMAIARRHRSSKYCRQAQQKYGSALLSLADLCRRGEPQDQDAIFLAMLFLGFFEVIASYDISYRESWMTHLGGVGTLFKQRGEDFINTDFGTRMFLQSRSQVVMNALQAGTAVPEAFKRLSRTVHPTISPVYRPFYESDMLLIRLADLQAQGCIGAPDDFTAALAALDQDLQTWMKCLPPSWSFSEHPIENASGMWWDVRCDVYSSPITQFLWNKIRTARIIIYELLKASTTQPPAARANTHCQSICQPSSDIADVTIRWLITDICSTLPAYYRPSSVGNGAAKRHNPPLLGPTYWHLWPLEVIGSMPESPHGLAIWVLRCLERIHDTTGIVMAQQIIDRLKARRSTLTSTATFSTAVK